MADMYDLAGEPRPKLCVNCKHVAKSSSGDAQNWKCFAEQNIHSRSTDLVTGLTVIKRWFLTCYDARAADVQRRENCGPEGRWFEEAPPKFSETPSVDLGRYAGTYGGTRASATDLLSQLDKMK